jgi:hypothetical protein
VESAKAVLAANWTGEFTKPAPSLYPHQWNWDSGFIALAYAHYDLDKAMAELSSLFQGQWKNGMLPHIVFRPDQVARYFPGPSFWDSWRSDNAPASMQTSGITQPPVHALALHAIHQLSSDPVRSLAFLRRIYPQVLAMHRYFYQERDPAGEGLVHIRHPWEGGTDNSPLWDRALKRIDLSQIEMPQYERLDLRGDNAAFRPTQKDYDYYVFLLKLAQIHQYDEAWLNQNCPFQVIDPMFNAILIRANECLLEIADWLREPKKEIKDWLHRSREAMNAKLWNPEKGQYDAWDRYARERIPMVTSSGLLPLLGGIPSQRQAKAIHKRLLSPSFSGSAKNPAWLCPTTDLKSKWLDRRKYWRGPVWINTNWMLHQGLLRYGYDKTAQRVKEDSLYLLENLGFYEYFDPFRDAETIVGYGTEQFSWSAALYLDWHYRKANN